MNAKRVALLIAVVLSVLALGLVCSGPHFLDTFHGSLRGAWTWRCASSNSMGVR